MKFWKRKSKEAPEVGKSLANLIVSCANQNYTKITLLTGDPGVQWVSPAASTAGTITFSSKTVVKTPGGAAKYWPNMKWISIGPVAGSAVVYWSEEPEPSGRPYIEALEELFDES